MQRWAAGEQGPVPGKRGEGAGAVFYGSGRVDRRTLLRETDIMTESPLTSHT
jgi:hypothetical protein